MNFEAVAAPSPSPVDPTAEEGLEALAAALADLAYDVAMDRIEQGREKAS